MKTNTSKLITLDEILKVDNAIYENTSIIIEDLRSVIQSFSTISTSAQNITFHKYIEKISVNTLNNVVSVYIIIQNPMSKSSPMKYILEKIIYSQFLK